jgi:7-carboxy-7-deazaguanine synthase
LLQAETPELVSSLIERGYSVSIETNGSLSIDSLDPRCIKVVDIKCPSSGMQDKNCMENIQHLGPNDQIKFVIADRSDFQFALSVSKRLISRIDAQRILFSPVHGKLPADRLAGWMLESITPARLQIQLHKLLWPGKERGV